MNHRRNRIGASHSILRLRPKSSRVRRDVGADARSRVQGVELRWMTDYQMNVAVNPSVFVFAHLVGKNAGRVVILRICGSAGWSADILPAFSSISAARDAALFDADKDFVRHPSVQGDAANVSGVRRWGKGPLVVFRQAAECGQFAERPAAVFAHVYSGR